jgi:hypothetical protein
MALYKYNAFLMHSDDNAFDLLHGPGAATPFSGIYRCHGCGREDVSTYGHPLPPQNHHQHAASQGLIQWRLIVAADHQPK